MAPRKGRRDRPTPPRSGPSRAAPSLRAPLSPARRQYSFTIGILTVAVGLWAFAYPLKEGGEVEWLGLLVVVIGLGALAHAFQQRHDFEDKLIIDQRGVWYFEWDLPPVAWDQIHTVVRRGYWRRAMLVILLRDPDGYLRSLPPDAQRRFKFDRLLKPGQLRIPNGTLAVTLDEAKAAIEAGLTSRARR